MPSDLLKKFGLSTSNLPPGYQIINQPLSFYEQYRRMVWQVLFVFILLLVFLLILSINLVKKRTAENRLKKSDERFELAMKFANDGLFDWDMQADTVYFSPGWKRLLGYEDHEIKSELSEWERLTNPEDLKAAWNMIKDVAHGKKDRFETERSEERRVGKECRL